MPGTQEERKSYLEVGRKGRNAGFTKHGSKLDGTASAHRLSHRVVNGILSHLPGTAGHGRGEKTDSEAISRVLNQDVNCRIKTVEGNKKDDDLDKKIVLAHKDKTHILDLKTAMRAVQAYKGGMAANQSANNLAVARVVQDLGEMTYQRKGKLGRPTKIKNLAK